MSAKISETIKVDQALGPVDINTAKTSGWFSMQHYRRAYGVVTTDTVAQTKSATVQLLQAQDASGTGSKPLTDVVSKTAPTGGAKLTVGVDVMSDHMDEGFTHIAVKATTDAGATLNAAAVLLRSEGRYGVSMP